MDTSPRTEKNTKREKEKKNAQNRRTLAQGNVLSILKIALGERTREIRQSPDTTRMSPLKGNAILIRSALLYCTSFICVKVVAKYSF